MHRLLTFNSSHKTPAATEQRGNVSITSLKFLEQGREHLFLTAADGTSHLRLWDIRANYDSRRGTSTPLAITGGIPSHENNRHYGINSLSLSTDGARIYSVCRDSTVYVYSTNHLILGQALELSQGSSARWSRSSEIGLGPLYGLQDQHFSTTTFYVRSAIRKATNQHEELLAVGSGQRGPVLFGTDEKLLRKSGAGMQTEAAFPVYRQGVGTFLAKGHDQEVTSVAWSSEGDLVSLSDDGTARAWREVGGNKERGCAWADVDMEWFEEDG